MATAEWELGGDRVQELHVDAGVAMTAADRAQIDIQVATAKQYPRDIARSKRDALALVSTDEDTAGSMFYALPRKQKGKTVHIEGPSVRFAETLVYCWGNIRAEARIVAIDATHITAQGTCLDLEKNVGARVEVQRRITDANGKRYSEDMIVMTGNAACSIAYRNSVFKVIPMALAKGILDQAKRFATGGAVPIEARRQRALAWFARVGAPEARVLDLLGVATADEITEEHIVSLVGLKNAIQDGDTTVEEAFGGASGRAPTGQVSSLNEKLSRAAAAPIDDLAIPEPDLSGVPLREPDARERYPLLLAERGITGDADRRALQKRLHAEGRVSSANVTAWTDDDYTAALAALSEIPTTEKEG